MGTISGNDKSFAVKMTNNDAKIIGRIRTIIEKNIRVRKARTDFTGFFKRQFSQFFLICKNGMFLGNNIIPITRGCSNQYSERSKDFKIGDFLHKV
jgi:hypothetical protein